jgi:phage terminase small subunit
MPALKNARHERFAQELAKGMTAEKAYGLAGYKESRAGASRLAAKTDVSRRVAEILDRGAVRAEITLKGLIEEAAEIQRGALAAGQHAAAVSALTAKAKLAGLWVERTQGENTNVNYAIGDEPPTEAEWKQKHVTAH